MCLWLGNKKGHIAENDIVCFKALEIEDGKYKTPFQDTTVTLGEYLTPKLKTPELDWYGYKYTLKGGVIHALLDTTKYNKRNYVLFKAIIEKGTRFWIQDDLTQIAAEKLFITSEKCTGEFDFTSLIPYASKVITNDGKLENVKSNDQNIIGISTGNYNVSLNIYHESLSKSQSGIYYRDGELKDFNGILNTKGLNVNYLKENEYIPSLGELTEVLKNMAEINITRKILGKELIPYAIFWSSTPSNEYYFYSCYSDGGICYSLFTHSETKNYILPLLIK